nr:hypothetical protein [uncultured Pedobacter sp.]
MFTKLQFVAPLTYNIISAKAFSGQAILPEDVQTSFEFAFDMSFGKAGHHRNHRTGGDLKRKNGEIFINAFQGKLAEFAFYNWLKNNGIATASPDVRLMGEGMWDDSDFTVNGKKISIKSAAHFSNLMLLETQDWDIHGNYIPNIETRNASYDYFVLVRIKPDGKHLMKENRLCYATEVEKEFLKQVIFKEKWLADLVGFATKSDLQFIIANQHIIPKCGLLNGKTSMDANNYYLQSGDMAPIENLLCLLT